MKLGITTTMTTAPVDLCQGCGRGHRACVCARRVAPAKDSWTTYARKALKKGKR
jgi:hypothetical protein